MVDIYSRLSRRSKARGSSTGLVPVVPANVKARKSILFTEGTPEVKIIMASMCSGLQSLNYSCV